MNKYILILIFLIKIYNLINCKGNEILKYDSKINNYKCLKCPENCSYCYYDNSNNTYCNICEEGYFLDENKLCKSCFKNCEHCEGSEIDDCINIKNGFYYDIKQEKIQTCPKNCLRCKTNGSCTSCSSGYYSSNDHYNKKGIITETECKECNIPNCEFCGKQNNQLGINEIIVCNFCKEGFGLSNGTCKKCSENCKFCYTDNNVCSYCEEGFYLNNFDKTCKTIPIENCNNYVDNSCLNCSQGYYLKDNKCEILEKEVINCYYGNYDLVKKSFLCLNCHRGFYLNENKCEKCDINCDYCTKEKCNLCSHGYVLNKESKCVKCNIQNCINCLNLDQCIECKMGYFFDNVKKTCTKCSNNCGYCIGPEQKNCLSCPFNKFLAENERVIKTNNKNTGLDDFVNKNSFLSVFFGDVLNSFAKITTKEIIIEKSCYSKCPSIIDGKNVTVNYDQKLCVINKNSTISNINLSQINNTKNTYHSICKLFMEYKSEIKKTKSESKEKNNISKEKNNKSKECNYNGLLKKIFNSLKENYFICYCDDEFIGDNCEIKIGLYKSVNLKLLDILNILEKNINVRPKNIELEMKVLKYFSNFKLNKVIIMKIYNIINLFIQKNKSIDNRKDLYVVLDTLILSLFDLEEDLNRKKNFVDILDIENIDQKKEIYQTIDKIRELIIKCFNGYNNLSFLKKRSKSYFNLFNLYSYELMEFNIDEKRKEYQIKNPFIDTVSKHFKSNTYIRIKPFNSSIYNLQLISFANELFYNLIVNTKKKLSTNLLMLRLINNQTHMTYDLKNLEKSKYLIINFYIRGFPTIADLKKILKCSVIENGKIKTIGVIDEINEEENRVVCFYDIKKLKQNHLLLIVENDISENVEEDNNHIINIYEKYKLKNNVKIFLFSFLFLILII